MEGIPKQTVPTVRYDTNDSSRTQLFTVLSKKMPRIEDESGDGGSRNQPKKYTVGTRLAVDLYDHGNFFEATVKNTNDLKTKGVVKVQYFDKDETVGTIDLNQTPTVELVQGNILALDDCANEHLSNDQKGFLGRRLTVQWEDNQRYSGTIIKTLRNQKSFVFIRYDDGDSVWYNLSHEKERAVESSTNQKSSGKSAPKPPTKIKSESFDEATSRKSNSAKKASQPDSNFEEARRELAKKYPIGCRIAVDSYHDQHYHEATLRKYIPNPSKAQQAKGEQWVYLHWLDKEKPRNWVDLNCIKAVKIVPEEIFMLDDLQNGQDKGFLGKRIVVQWKDGNKYCGLATKCSKDNKHFVFLEYDDGDQCWCDLQSESYWSIDGEDTFDDYDDGSSSSESSAEEDRARTQPKRKTSSQATSQSTKKTKPTEESYDF